MDKKPDLPTGLQLTRQLVHDLLPGAKISSGLESIPLSRNHQPALFSIQYKSKYATFILDTDDGKVLLRKTGDKRQFDLRIPTIMPELKTYLKELFSGRCSYCKKEPAETSGLCAECWKDRNEP